MKSCENCNEIYCRPDIDKCNNCKSKNCECGNCNEFSNWKPDYPTLERENAELTQALERACEWIGHDADRNGVCYNCPLEGDCCFGSGASECKAALVKYFKEGQDNG